MLAEISGLSKVNPQNIGGVLGMAEWFVYESSENLPSAPGTTVRLDTLAEVSSNYELGRILSRYVNQI